MCILAIYAKKEGKKNFASNKIGLNKTIQREANMKHIKSSSYNLKKQATMGNAWSEYSRKPLWNYTEDRMGNVTIEAPDGRSCFLQGDDASSLLYEIDAADKYLKNAKRYAWTIDQILSEYDHVCE